MVIRPRSFIMKTIRENVFETNSSSTHSVTIAVPSKKKTVVPYVVNNQLMIDAPQKNSESYGDTSVIKCNDTVSKAAWFCAALMALRVYDVPRTVITDAIDKIVKELSYEGWAGNGFSDFGEDMPSVIYSFLEDCREIKEISKDRIDNAISIIRSDKVITHVETYG